MSVKRRIVKWLLVSITLLVLLWIACILGSVAINLSPIGQEQQRQVNRARELREEQSTRDEKHLAEVRMVLRSK
jgi:Na+-transporting NADH:ubiquinone oxidoreductase subunit NqrC